MKGKIAFGVVLITISVSLIAAAQQSSISGQIADSEGAAVAKARVLVRWDSSGSTGGSKDIGIQQDVTATTDATGHYLIVLPPGFYDVLVSAQAFTPAAAKVRVNRGRGSTFNARLNADPLITNELGDTFLPAGIEALATPLGDLPPDSYWRSYAMWVARRQ